MFLELNCNAGTIALNLSNVVVVRKSYHMTAGRGVYDLEIRTLDGVNHEYSYDSVKDRDEAYDEIITYGQALVD